MLAEARTDTEIKVKQELSAMRDKLTMLDQSLDSTLAYLDSLDDEDQSARAAASADEIENELSRVRDETEYELTQLKKELHDTILAHNHNADFIKSHKETIDSLRARAEKMLISGGKAKGGAAKTHDVKEQLAKLQALPKVLPQDDRVEPLLKRVAALEQLVKKAQKSRPGAPAATAHNVSQFNAAAVAAAMAANNRWGAGAYSGLTAPGAGGLGGHPYSMMAHGGMGMGGMGAGPPGYMGPMAGGKGGGKRNSQQQAAALQAYTAAQREKALAHLMSRMDPYGLNGMGSGPAGLV